MTHKTYTSFAAIIFLFVFTAHLLRLIYGWYIEIGGWLVPMWISWVGVLFAGFLSAYGFRLSRQK